MVKAADLIATARSYVGTPYHHQGRLPGVGLDCIGLVLCAARATGCTWGGYEDDLTYAALPDGRLYRHFLACTIKVWDSKSGDTGHPLANAQDADIAMIAWKREPMHVAYVHKQTGRWMMIHAYANIERAVEHTLDDKWLSRIRCVFRSKDVEQ